MKLMRRSCLFVLVLTLLLSLARFNNVQATSAFGATYEVTNNVTNEDLGYGINHIKDISVTTTEDKGDKLNPQQVNVLNVPSSKEVRIVNWTYANKNGWSKQTVRAMANNFEQNNPGWVVIGAVNGDFFDINADNTTLPYQTSGVTVSWDEVYRPIKSGTSIGFTNDGSAEPLVAEEYFEVSAHQLNIFNENNEIIYSKEVKFFNQEPTTGEIAIWYDCPNSGKSITIPNTNTYVSVVPERVLAMSSSQIYAKGKIGSINTLTSIRYGQFAIQTTDPEIQSLLNVGTTVRVQQNVVGAYANCTDITGGGMVLVRDGAANPDVVTNKDCHPRTCVGMKADGTIVFVTVDGRQSTTNKVGMNYEELSAMMLHYGCTEAYNLDGGGSTTMIIRNAYGDFDVVNSPSDGSERNDSNTLLIVVPELNFEIKEVSDTEITFDYVLPVNGVNINDIKVTINNQTKTISEFPYTWSGLTKETEYEINASYHLTYNGLEKEKNLRPIAFKTGYQSPTLNNLYTEKIGQNIVLHYELNDPSNTLIILSIFSGSYYDILDASKTSISIPKEYLDINDIKLTLEYNLKSSTKTHVSKEITTKRGYNITYDLDGGTLTNSNPSYYYENEGVVSLHQPTKEGYSFKGWLLNGVLVDSIPTTSHGDITLSAKWQEIEVETKKGCKKSSAELIINTLSLLSVVMIVVKKKH